MVDFRISNWVLGTCLAMGVMFGPIGGFGIGSAHAQSLTNAGPDLTERMAKRERDLMKRNPTHAKQNLIMQAFRISNDGTVTKEAADTAQQIIMARARGSNLGRLLASDLNGDGMVSGEELEASAKGAQARQRAKIMTWRFTIDTNDDGWLTYDEMLLWANKSTKIGGRVRQNQWGKFEKMDINGDGATTIEEIIAYVDNVSAQNDVRPYGDDGAENDDGIPKDEADKTARDGAEGAVRIDVPELNRTEDGATKD